jgi:hypothetical protein
MKHLLHRIVLSYAKQFPFRWNDAKLPSLDEIKQLYSLLFVQGDKKTLSCHLKNVNKMFCSKA